MKYIYSASQMSKLSLTLYTFSITGSVAGLFLTYIALLALHVMIYFWTLFLLIWSYFYFMDFISFVFILF